MSAMHKAFNEFRDATNPVAMTGETIIGSKYAAFEAGWRAAIDAALKAEPNKPASEESILEWGERIATLKEES